MSSIVLQKFLQINFNSVLFYTLTIRNVKTPANYSNKGNKHNIEINGCYAVFLISQSKGL